MSEKFKEILNKILSSKFYYDEESANKYAKKRWNRLGQFNRCEFQNSTQRWWRKYQSMIVRGESKEEFEEAERTRYENLKYKSFPITTFSSFNDLDYHS